MQPSKLTPTDSEPQPLQLPTSEQRENLLKVLKAKPGEKPVTLEQYHEVRVYMDRRRGGIKSEAFDLFSNDKEMLGAAMKNRVTFAQEVKEFEAGAKQCRALILKALRSKPGEKPLSMPEFKQVVDFLDRKGGGLRGDTREVFKYDREILDADRTHREEWQSRSANRVGEEESEPPSGDKPLSNAQILEQFVDSHAPGLDEGPNERDELEPGV